MCRTNLPCEISMSEKQKQYEAGIVKNDKSQDTVAISQDRVATRLRYGWILIVILMQIY